MERKVISTGTRFEKIFGYARAVRVGPFISVAGTTAMGPDGPVGGPDVAEQAREVLHRIRAALEEAGASLQDVVRTRVFVADVSEWERVGEVHSEFFAEILPASTIVEAKLADPRLLIEIEADAVTTD
ncbi:RidA family protein [Micromonospora sp. NPDC049051]|uniref:RidA family protein n=1 Tax=unclassified Micromonospora TaxID=2617518 RepID=UPI00371C9CB1